MFTETKTIYFYNQIKKQFNLMETVKCYLMLNKGIYIATSVLWRTGVFE
jgi:hypothetical protein